MKNLVILYVLGSLAALAVGRFIYKYRRLLRQSPPQDERRASGPPQPGSGWIEGAGWTEGNGGTS